MKHTGPPPAVRIVPSDAPPKDDGRFHHHKNDFALEQVGEEAHHFTAWYSDVEPSHCEATVVEVEDDRGNVVDRSYPARGKVVGEGPALATPAGLVLPGTSSKEADALRWTWPGNTQATSFDFTLSPQLFASPRR